MNKMYLVLGDWSNDGHGQSDKILVEINKKIEEVQDAYKDSCKLTGISFNGNIDYTETKRSWEIADQYKIAINYKESKLTNEVLEVLTKFKCPKEILENYNEEAYEGTYIPLWFWFVKLSIPDLKYNINEDIPCINGYWNKNLNVGFGYGLYL